MIQSVYHQDRFAQEGWIVFVIGEVWFGHGWPGFGTGGWSALSRALLIYTEDFRQAADLPCYTRQDLVDIHDFLKAKVTSWIEIN